METSIISAIMKGLFRQVRFLVQLGLSVNERDLQGRTPLCILGLIDDQKWSVSLARLLIEHGGKIGLRDKQGLNAMHFACINEKLELMKVYLSAMDFNLNQADKHGNTALHHAVASGNVDSVRIIVSALLKYKMSIDKINKMGASPLIHAWKLGKVDCALLIKEMANPDLDHLRDFQEHKSALEWEQDTLSAMQEKDTSSKCPSLGHSSEEQPLRGKLQGVVHSEKVSLELTVPRPSLVSQSNKVSVNNQTKPRSNKCQSETLTHEPSMFESTTIGQSETLSFLNNSSMNSVFNSPTVAGSSEISRHSRTFITRPKSTPSSISSVPSGSTQRLKQKPLINAWTCEYVKRNDLCHHPIHHAENSIRNKLEYLYQISNFADFMNETDGPCFKQQQQTSYHMSESSQDDWRGVMRSLYNTYSFQFTPSYRNAALEPERPASPGSECISDALSQLDKSGSHASMTKRMRKFSNVTKGTQLRDSKKLGVKEMRRGRRLSIATDTTDDASDISSCSASVAESNKPKSKWLK